MSFYKLVCRRCGAAFEKQASISDRAEKRILCPECGSGELEPDYSAGSASIHIKPGNGNKDCSTCGCNSGCGCAHGHGGHR